MKTDGPLQLRIGGVVLLVLGPVLALFAGALYLHAQQAQAWPTVEARVTQSKVETSKKASGFRRTRTHFEDYYTAVIRYEYEVDGERFKGDRIALDGGLSSGFDREDAERWVRRCPVGAAVAVHYSPRDPKQSVIDPSPDTFGLVLTGVLGLVAIPAGLVLRRLGRRGQPPGEVRSAPVSYEADVPAAPPAVASVPPSAAYPPLMKQPPLQEVRPIHWLIRTVAVVTGVPLFFFGCLALYVSVKLLVRQANAPDHGAIGIVVHVVMVGIMGGVAWLGAFLTWKGAKGKRRSRSG